MKELGGTTVMTERSDTDNDVYRNASTKAVLAAETDRYSQGIFDLSLLVAGGNSESYFKGTMSSGSDVDYFMVIPNLSIMSAAGISPYPLTVQTGIGTTFSMIPSRLYLAINSSFFFKS